MWASLTTAVQESTTWVELTSTINNGLQQISATNVLSSARQAATGVIDGLTNTEAFQAAQELTTQALATADTTYMETGWAQVANAAHDAVDAAGTAARGAVSSIGNAQNALASAATSYVKNGVDGRGRGNGRVELLEPGPKYPGGDAHTRGHGFVRSRTATAPKLL